jgi:hypothetical protein
MSASTGTIQRPMVGGSILRGIAFGVAALFAVGALAWGAANLTATRHVATPVAAPQYLDRGGRELPLVASKSYLPAAAASQWSVTGSGATGSTTHLANAAPKSYLPVAAANQWSMTGTGATGSAGLGGYFGAVAAGSGHAAPLIDRNAENFVVNRGGGGERAE